MFNEWLAAAKKGDTYVYFKGHLAATRQQVTDALREDRPVDTDLGMLEAAGDAWRAYEAGKVVLTQRREGAGFDYVATRV